MDGSRSSKREMVFRFVHKVPPLVYESGNFLSSWNLDLRYLLVDLMLFLFGCCWSFTP